MRHLIFLAALSVATPAFADASDDYVACLVGRAAVEVHGGAAAPAALEAAYKVCPEPKGIDENEAEGLADYVNLVVEDIADR